MEAQAAVRARFLLDFGYATGLRAEELVGLTLDRVGLDNSGDWWLQVKGKGGKEGRVALPPLGLAALRRTWARVGSHLIPSAGHLRFRLYRNSKAKPASASLGCGQSCDGSSTTIASAAMKLDPPQEGFAQRLGAASTHWMRHTHATHALKKAPNSCPFETICGTRQWQQRQSICALMN
jgi:integrase